MIPTSHRFDYSYPSFKTDYKVLSLTLFPLKTEESGANPKNQIRPLLLKPFP
ncbi:hypothetical protein EVA_03763 [gut metagenome]|uniref:Uncharacterized protein n=1 Tax=gut metagenome TaxID=749906 RepID=J9H3C0_9ZZZZ